MKNNEILEKLEDLKNNEYIKIHLTDGVFYIVENFAIENNVEKEFLLYKIDGTRFDYANIINIL